MHTQQQRASSLIVGQVLRVQRRRISCGPITLLQLHISAMRRAPTPRISFIFFFVFCVNHVSELCALHLRAQLITARFVTLHILHSLRANGSVSLFASSWRHRQHRKNANNTHSIALSTQTDIQKKTKLALIIFRIWSSSSSSSLRSTSEAVATTVTS